MPEPRDVAQAPDAAKDVDVLAGAAILLVLVLHLPISLGAPVSDKGPGLDFFAFWSGIDLLLAIAGFRAARELGPSLAAAGGLAGKLKTVVDFWRRCAWRVLPTAWFWIAATLVCSAAFNRSGAFGPLAPALKAAFTARAVPGRSDAIPAMALHESQRSYAERLVCGCR